MEGAMVRWLHGSPARIAAALLALSVSAPGLLGPGTAPSCCCAHAEQNCHCPVCEHARELESGQRHLKSCRAGAGNAISLTAISVALPPPHAEEVVAYQPAPRGEPALPPDPLQREVPTPPPLA